MYKKCNNCGAFIYVIDDCHCKCGFMCCDEKMEDVVPNSVDAAFEKHVPTYTIKENKMEVTVNHVMDDDHYIEWISMESPKEIVTKKLAPHHEATVTFDYYPHAKLYAYCNKHGLWEKEVEE